MEAEEFEELVLQAIESLPDQFREALDNVDIVIEEWPSFNTLRRAHLRSKYELFGLYDGVALTKRDQGYNLIPPDKISIYKGPIEAAYATPDEVRATVRRTVLHEIAHHFGISDERLDELGAY